MKPARGDEDNDPDAGNEAVMAGVLQRWLVEHGYAVHVVDADAVAVLREVVDELEAEPRVRFGGVWREALATVVERFEARRRAAE